MPPLPFACQCPADITGGSGAYHGNEYIYYYTMRPLPPRLPSCRVLVCYAFVYSRTARLCSLPCHCSYALCIVNVCPPCSSMRPCCNAGGFLSRADPAAPCPAFLISAARCRMPAAYMSMCLYVYVSTRLHVYMFTRLHVYMFTCLHVYKLPPEMAYLSAIWNAQRDKQRPEQ